MIIVMFLSVDNILCFYLFDNMCCMVIVDVELMLNVGNGCFMFLGDEINGLIE